MAEGALANPVEAPLPSTDRLPSGQAQFRAALEAPLESERPTLQSQDESSGLVVVDQQDAMPSPEDSSIAARAPPAAEGPNLLGMGSDGSDLEQVALGESASTSQALGLFAVSPALFVENQGQWSDSSVQYLHDGKSMDVALTDSGVWFQATRPDLSQRDSPGLPGLESDPFAAADTPILVLPFSASFVGAGALEPVGLGQSQTVFNYCVGDQADWRQNVPSYEIVVYEGLYEGIDLHIQGLRSHLKYEFHVVPGADYRQIAVRYEGIEGLSLAEDGSLEVDLGGQWGVIRDDAPYIYQEIDGREVDVAGRFILLDDRTYSFEITGDIDPDHVLVIDPDLAWSTYLGGSGLDEGLGIAADASGNVYLTGGTFSSGWTSGGYDTSHNGSTDAFVAKLSSSGAHLWSTYLGGSSFDGGEGIALDATGNVYVAGYTDSAGWTSNGHDTSHNGGTDAFAAKLNSNGAHLWSTYLGGSGYDHAHGLAVSGAGGVYVTGRTYSAGWASGGFDITHNGYSDAFVAGFSSGGYPLWSTYLGGNTYDEGYGIAADASGNVYVTGATESVGWTSGGYDTSHNGGSDAFVAKLSFSGAHLWSTYLGSSGEDYGHGIATDASGSVYVTGGTASTDWAVGGFDTTHNGGYDAFVAKLNSSGGHLWSTYLGGSADDESYGIAVDGSGGVYLTGRTYSAGWTSGGFDTTLGGTYDAFLAMLSSAGAHLWSSYLGGSSEDMGRGVAVDAAGALYVSGWTNSPGWTSGGFDTTHNGGSDAFVAKVVNLVPLVEIAVLGNGVSIADGDTTPSMADHTDFGSVVQWGTATGRTFTVRNDGSATLTLGSVSVPTGFTLTKGLPSSLGPGASDTFTVRLDTVATVGTKTGDVSFTNSDSDENPFNFRITGTVNPPESPQIAWSTYLGGSASDEGYSITVDVSGNVYLTGTTRSPGWTSGGFDTSHNGYTDAFVAKFNSNGAHLWSSYLGGSEDDCGEGIAVDASGNVYVAGYTWSSGWTSGGFDTTYKGAVDAFVAKLSSSGAHLWSTYLGGSGGDFGDGIAVDAGGSVYVSGDSYSAGWTTGGFDTTHNGGADAFVAKLSSSGAHLWSSYLGGSEDDYGPGIALDGSGGVYVTGNTMSSGWTSGGFDTGHNGSTDAFVAKLSSSGAHLWSTYLGGSNGDQGQDITVDGSGGVLVTGITWSSGWTSGGFDTTHNGDNDAFVAKLSSSGAHLWSTYLGGSNGDQGRGIAVDGSGGVLVTGTTGSSGWTSGGFDTSYNGNGDAFVAKLSSSGAHLWSSYLGGNDYDEAGGIAVDGSGNVYVTGQTYSSGWTSGGFDITYNGIGDAFVAKITAPAPEITVLGNGISIPDGDTTPSLADHTDFDLVAQGGTPISRTFTVRNDGTATLTLGAVTVPAGFTLTEGLSTSLAPGASDTFTVRLDTAFVGTKAGDITFTNNDADENPFNFQITGTVSPIGTPEITVLGNGAPILDGDLTPSTTDGTSFGSVAQGAAPVSHTFTVRNDGSALLTLGAVTVPTGFTVTEGLVASLADGASDTFTVRLDTATAGTKTGDVSFSNNDADNGDGVENPFNFRITGTVLPPAVPEITVLGNGVSISDGDTTPSTADDTDFGSVIQGGSAVSHTFTVRNDGTATLTLGAVAVPTGFTLMEPLSSSLAPGASDTFTVHLDTATLGTKTGDVSFSNNDSDENPFNFRITGIVEASPSGEIIGNTTVFSEVTMVANRRAVPYTMTEAGELESISIYHEGGSGHVLLAVYADSAGKPGIRLGVTASTAINATEGWQTVSLPAPVSVSSGQTIWLAWAFENNPGIRFTAGTPGRADSPAAWSSGMPNPFGSSTVASFIYSIYATYSPSTGTSTVGNTTVFSQVTAAATRRAAPYTMPEAGQLESISIYHDGGSGHLILAVYADSAGKPGTRLGVTASTAINATEGWQTVSLPAPVSVASGQTIWLAWVFENNPGIRFTAGTPGRADSSATWSGGMPNLFGACTIDSYIYSLYATYNTEPDTTPPADVSGFVATTGDEQISLSWTNPADADLAGVKILRKTSGYPTGPTDGTVAYDGTGTSTMDTGLTNGTTYYYTAFSYDAVPNYSAGATASGTPEVSTTSTIGNKTIFSDVTTVPNRRAAPYTMAEAGQLESISIYHQGGSGRVILAVYGDSAGKPGARLGMTNSTVINATQGWQTVNLQSPVSVSAGQTVWLAWVFENNPGIRFTTGTPGRADSSATWSGGMPSPFGACTIANYIYSLYATYSPSAGVNTVGNTTVFSDVTTVPNRRAAPYTMTEAGQLESISIYHQGGSGHVLLAVYGDSAGKPGTRLGVTNSTVINATQGWQTVSVQSPVSVASGQTIWLAWVFENNPGIRFTTGTPGRADSSATWSGGMPTTFGTSTIDGYIYSLYATYSTGPDTTPPADVSGFTATAGHEQISLSWTNPADADFAGVKILRKTGSHPTSPTDGTVVYDGAGTSTTDTGLTNGTTYYYTAFSYDGVPNYSAGATTSGTPEASTTSTIGNTTVFSEVTLVPNRRAVPYTMPEAGQLESISIYHDGGSGHLILAVYADSAGKPGTRLSITNSTVINATEGWQTVSLQSPVSVASGQTIWLAWVFENNPGIRFTTGTPGRADSSATWSGGMPNPFGASTVASYIYSLYATYSPSSTVGNTTVFSDVTTVANRRAVPYTASTSGSLGSISLYHQGGSGQVLLAVYGDSGGLPGTRLGITSSTPVSSTQGWQTVNLQSPVSVSAGQTIWLAWVFENNPGIRFTIGTPGRADAGIGWSGGMPTTFGSSTLDNYIYSIYANYL